jgi:hypothetical protein
MDQRNPPPKNLAPARRAAPVAILYGAGRWTEAEAAARRLATEEPERPEHQAWLGFLAARQGRRSEADQVAAGLAARRGPYLRGRHTLGRAAIAAGLGPRWTVPTPPILTDRADHRPQISGSEPNTNSLRKARLPRDEP